MAELVIVPASVLAGANAQYLDSIAGVAITAGQCCYLDAATRTLLLAAADTAPHATVRGIALHGAAVGQPMRLLVGGDLAVGTILTAGKLYAVAATPGGMIALDELVAGNFQTILGLGLTTQVLQLKVWATGMAVPA